jgi:N-terminal acetyltransferase B complex non-catalytic subunit
MALRKAFPQDRQYDYWNILMYFLVSRDNSLPEKERTLFGNLAQRLVSKAAEGITTSAVSASGLESPLV